MGLWKWLSERTEGKRPETPDQTGGQEIPEAGEGVKAALDEPPASDEPRKEEDPSR